MRNRMKMLGVVTAGCVVALLVIFNVEARAEEEDYAQNGFYVGVGVGYGVDQHGGCCTPNFELGLGIDAWAGFRVHPRVAIEGQLEYLDILFKSNTNVEYSVLTMTGNLKLFLLTGRIQPYALGGVGITQSQVQIRAGVVTPDIDETDISARFGGGIDFYITEHVSVGTGASYVVTTGSSEGLDYISGFAGVQIRF